MGLFSSAGSIAHDIGSSVTDIDRGIYGTYRDNKSSAGYLGPAGMVLGRPKGETYPQWFLNSLGGGVLGVLGNPVGKHEDAKAAEERAKQQRYAQAKAQDRIDMNLAQIDENYGVGDTADAHTNAGTIGGILDKTTTDYQAGQNDQLQGLFSKALSQNRFSLADRGLSGSGVESDVTRDTVGSYLGGRQQVAQNAGMYRTSLEDGLTQQRNTIKNEVMKGTNLDPNTLQEIGDAQFSVNQAKSNIPGQTIGNIFSQSGGALGQRQVATANGGGGLWPTTNSQPTQPQVFTRPSSSGGSSGRIS